LVACCDILSPGQRMSELDMFASQRTNEDPDKPYRPTLDAAKGYWHSENQQESNSLSPKQKQPPKHRQHKEQFQQQQQPQSSGKPYPPGPSVAQPHPNSMSEARAPGSPPQTTNPFRQVPLRKAGGRGGSRGQNNRNV